MLCRNRRGQSSLEYTLIITAVIAAVVAMGGYVKRGIQGRVRASSDQIGDQFAITDKSSFTFKRNTYGGVGTHDATASTLTKEDRLKPGTTKAGGSGGDILSNITDAEVVVTKEKDDWYDSVGGKQNIAGDVADPGN